MQKQYTTEEKQNLVAMFKNETQTSAFAQANGINPLTFRSWLYVKTETTGFVEIKTPVRITEKKYKNPERRN